MDKRIAAVAALPVVLVAILVAFIVLRPERSTIPDGEWELVATSFENEIETQPLYLSSTSGRLGGDNGCNSFGEEPNGDTFQTLAGCEGDREELERRVMAAVDGGRRINDEGHLVLSGGGHELTYSSIVTPLAVEVLDLLNRNDVIDPATVFFDPEGGPVGFDLVPVDSGDPKINVYLGSTDQTSICFNYVSEPITSGSGCRGTREFVRSGLVFSANGRNGPLGYHALIVPDAFLDDLAIRQLVDLGEIHGNLVRINDDTAGGEYTITNGAGDELDVRLQAGG